MGRPYSAASQLASASELRSRLRHQSTWYRGEPPANWRNFTHELARTETSFDTLPTATIPPLTRRSKQSGRRQTASSPQQTRHNDGENRDRSPEQNTDREEDNPNSFVFHAGMVFPPLSC